MKTLTSEGSPRLTKNRNLKDIPWKETSEPILTPIGEVLPIGTKYRVFQTRNFGFIAIHPDTPNITRKLFSE